MYAISKDFNVSYQLFHYCSVWLTNSLETVAGHHWTRISFSSCMDLRICCLVKYFSGSHFLYLSFCQYILSFLVSKVHLDHQISTQSPVFVYSQPFQYSFLNQFSSFVSLNNLHIAFCRSLSLWAKLNLKYFFINLVADQCITVFTLLICTFFTPFGTSVKTAPFCSFHKSVLSHPSLVNPIYPYHCMQNFPKIFYTNHWLIAAVCVSHQLLAMVNVYFWYLHIVFFSKLISFLAFKDVSYPHWFIDA